MALGGIFEIFWGHRGGLLGDFWHFFSGLFGSFLGNLLPLVIHHLLEDGWICPPHQLQSLLRRHISSCPLNVEKKASEMLASPLFRRVLFVASVGFDKLLQGMAIKLF